jgi:hypothetical protein
MQDRVASVSLVHVCLYMWYRPHLLTVCVMAIFCLVFQNTYYYIQVHHKIAEVDGTADLKMASSPTLPLPTHWLPMPVVSASFHWEIKDNIQNAPFLSLPHSLCSLRSQGRFTSIANSNCNIHSSYTSTPSISTGAIKGKRYRSTHSKFSSLRYTPVVHPFSFSCSTYIPSISQEQRSKIEKSASKRYGSTSKIRSLRYHHLSHPFSHSLLCIPSIIVGAKTVKNSKVNDKANTDAESSL